MVKNGHPMAEAYNLNGLVKAWEHKMDMILRGAPALIISHAPKSYGLAMVDGSMALSYLDLAASAYGLGCCWAGFFMIAASQSKAMQEILQLPEGNICVGGLMIGYPKFEYKQIPPRKAPGISWS
jgi:nitroreductase